MLWAGAGCGKQEGSGAGAGLDAAAALPRAPCLQLRPQGRFLPKRSGAAVSVRGKRRWFSQCLKTAVVF